MATKAEFTCKFCGKIYSSPYKLNDHMRNIHPEEIPGSSGTSNGGSSNGASSGSSSSSYRRNFPGPSGPRKRGHPDLVKQSKRPYECSKCGTGFKTPYLRDKHEKKICIDNAEYSAYKARKKRKIEELEAKREQRERRLKQKLVEEARSLERKLQALRQEAAEIDRNLEEEEEEEESRVELVENEQDDDYDLVDLPMPEWDEIDANDPTLGGLIAPDNTTSEYHRDFKSDISVNRFHFTSKARQLATTQQRARELIEQVFGFLTRGIREGPPSHVQALLEAPEALMYQFTTSFQDSEDFSIDSLMEKVDNYMGSDDEFGIDDAIVFEIRSVERMTAGGFRKFDPDPLHQLSEGMRCTWDPKSMEDKPLCFLRCIAGGLLRQGDPNYRKKYWYTKPNNCQYLPRMVDEIRQGSEIDKVNGPIEYEDMVKIHCWLNREYGMQLKVYDRALKNRCVFSGRPRRRPNKQIAVAVYDHHAFLILDERIYFEKRERCPLCFQLYQHNHTCYKRCFSCHTPFCPGLFLPVAVRRMQRAFCRACNRYFNGDRCLANHINNGTCATYVRCDDCKRTIKRHRPTEEEPTDPHLDVCGLKKCRFCKEDVPLDHLCTIQHVEPENLSPPDGIFREIIWDSETYTDSSNKHHTYLIWAVRRCQDCAGMNQVDLEECETCGKRWYYWYGERDITKKFCDWIFTDKANKNAIAISHNGSKFDHYFPLHYLVERGIKLSHHAITGGKVISLTGPNNVTFKDSFLFIPKPLAQLPETFGFNDVAIKSYFPHKMSKAENLGLQLDQLPAMQFYDPQNMTSKRRREFEHWYFENQHVPFDFKKQATEYGKDDVRVLAMAVSAFREKIIEVADVDPWYSATTLAQLAALIYRSKMMPEEDGIGIVPAQGYNQAKGKNSKIALAYLQYLGRDGTGKKIQTAFDSQGEKVVPGVGPVDGFCQRTNEIWEIAGCFYHSCQDPNCTTGQKNKPNHEHPLFRPMCHSDVYDKTMDKMIELRIRGYIVHLVWEHEILSLLKEDAEFKRFFEAKERMWDSYAGLIMPNSALFGGRCEPIASFRELTPEEIAKGWQIKHFDIISLYPSVMVKFLMPILHPEVLMDSQLPRNGEHMTTDDCRTYFGIWACTIQPPEELFLPVIPYRFTKLKFGLCRTCMQTENLEEFCTHTAEERRITGVWTSIELQLALEMGYQILKVTEIWHWPNQSEILFEKYVKTFLKLKLESSGVPEQFKDNPNEYIRMVEQEEGIKLDASAMEKNPGRRAVAKLLLNSLWGKFAQSLDRLHTVYAADYKELIRYLSDPRLEVCSLNIAGPRMAILTFRDKREYQLAHGMYNPCLASFVTSWGRLYLYEEGMRKLGTDLLYMDTDSVIFVSKPENREREPKVGLYLGDWTDETPGEFITKFVSSGSKSYAMITNKDRLINKFKGVRMSSACSKIMNWNAYKALSLNYIASENNLYSQLEDGPLKDRLMNCQRKEQRTMGNKAVVCVPDPTMVRDKQAVVIRNDSDRYKKIKNTFTKRKIVVRSDNNWSSVPLGTRAGFKYFD